MCNLHGGDLASSSPSSTLPPDSRAMIRDWVYLTFCLSAPNIIQLSHNLCWGCLYLCLLFMYKLPSGNLLARHVLRVNYGLSWRFHLSFTYCLHYITTWFFNSPACRFDCKSVDLSSPGLRYILLPSFLWKWYSVARGIRGTVIRENDMFVYIGIFIKIKIPYKIKIINIWLCTQLLTYHHWDIILVSWRLYCRRFLI